MISAQRITLQPRVNIQSAQTCRWAKKRRLNEVEKLSAAAAAVERASPASNLSSHGDSRLWQTFAALKEATEEAALKLRLWTLYYGNEEQLFEQIDSFFHGEQARLDSCAFNVEDDHDILQEMKVALGKLKVPADRCFWKVDDKDDDLYKYWFPEHKKEEVTRLHKSCARLAWVMENPDE